MRILAVETSSMVASVAILEEDNLMGEFTLNFKKTHSQTLLPLMEDLVKTLEIDLKSIDLIAVAKGPGSFTGLRIGGSSVKGLAMALGVKLMPVSTLLAMAYNFYGYEGFVCPIMDARRNQVYTGIYELKNGKINTILEDSPLDIVELMEKVNTLNKRVIFLGDGVPVFKDKIKELSTKDVEFAPLNLNRQKASSVGALAVHQINQGVEPISSEEFYPTYLRKSQAEREREERLGKDKIDN